MSVEMWIGVVLMAWCVVSVPVGLIVGAILQGRKRRAAAVLPASCLMCELEASHA
jgi:hypothetical protein